MKRIRKKEHSRISNYKKEINMEIVEIKKIIIYKILYVLVLAL